MTRRALVEMLEYAWYDYNWGDRQGAFRGIYLIVRQLEHDESEVAGGSAEETTDQSTGKASGRSAAVPIRAATRRERTIKELLTYVNDDWGDGGHLF